VLFLGTNYSAIIRPLQWLVVVLIFLFFLRVVRAIVVEVRPAGPSRADRRADGQQRPRRNGRGQLRLRVVEPPDREGMVYELDGEVTVGRSNGCGIPTTYDSYSSSLHARIYRSGGQVWVEDLGSTNGTYVNSERISQPVRLVKGDVLQIGATVFEVRR
jgi:hypothetical protein